jgi:DNA-binding transcriptional MerR regulator
MPIRFQYDAAAVAPPSSNELKKYGGQILMQQRKYDLDQRNDQARISQIGAMRNFNAEPSIGEDDAMLDQEIRSGVYDPDTVRSLRDDQRAMRQILRDRNIDGTQRAQAIGNIQSRMRMTRSTGKVQPMMQAQPSVLQTKPVTEADYFSDPKNYKEAYAAAQAKLVEAGPGTPPTAENIHAQMHNDYLAQQKFLEGLKQPQGQVPPQQGTPPVGNAPQQPVPPAGQPQASYSGGSTEAGFGVPPVMAQGGFQGAGQGAYQPTGDYTGGEPVFNVPPVLAQQAASQQATPAYPMEANAGMRAGQPTTAPQGGARKWTSNDGKYSRQGEFQGFAPGLSPSGSPIVMIKKSDNQETITVPLDRLSNEDRMFLSRDTQYSLQNPQMSAGQAYFDPNNPVYAEMRAADQSIVNPQKQTLGEPGGSRGLGQVNYGQGPSGQNVYADIVPGGTMPVARPRAATPEEQAYDEQQSQKYKEWRARQGATSKAETPSLTTLLSKMTPSQRRDYTKWLQADPNRYANRNAIAAQQLDQWENNVASGNLPTYPGSQKSAQGQPAAGKPAAKVDRSSPEVKAALKVAADLNATDEQQVEAIKTLQNAGFTYEEIKDIVPKPTASSGSTATDQSSTKQEIPSWGTQETLMKIPGWIYDQASEAAVKARRKYYGFPDEGNQSAASTASSQKYAKPTQESRDWQEWWSSQVPAFVSKGNESPSTWTSADGKKSFEGAVVRISRPADGTRYVSIKDKKGRVYSLDVKLLSEADRKKLESMYNAKS